MGEAPLRRPNDTAGLKGNYFHSPGQQFCNINARLEVNKKDQITFSFPSTKKGPTMDGTKKE